MCKDCVIALAEKIRLAHPGSPLRLSNCAYMPVTTDEPMI